MNELKIPCDTGGVSDGHHTFNELYEHRHVLFVALMKQSPDLSWMSLNHHDGTRYPGWFIAGMDLPAGAITYHLPDKMWMTVQQAAGVKVLENAPEWDGHDSVVVLGRIHRWIDKEYGL